MNSYTQNVDFLYDLNIFWIHQKLSVIGLFSQIGHFAFSVLDFSWFCLNMLAKNTNFKRFRYLKVQNHRLLYPLSILVQKSRKQVPKIYFYSVFSRNRKSLEKSNPKLKFAWFSKYPKFDLFFACFGPKRVK